MNQMRIVLAFVIGVVLVAGGCGTRQAAERIQLSNNLKELGILYHNYIDAHGGKPPQSIKDLESYAADYPGALKALQSGEVVFIYNVRLQGSAPAGTSATIIAYGKDVPQKGGPVLFMDGSTRVLTVQEFQAAPKAKPDEKASGDSK